MIPQAVIVVYTIAVNLALMTCLQDRSLKEVFFMWVKIYFLLTTESDFLLLNIVNVNFRDCWKSLIGSEVSALLFTP